MGKSAQGKDASPPEQTVQAPPDAESRTGATGERQGITFRAFLIGILFAALFAFVSVKAERTGWLLTSTQIPVLPYVLLFFSVFAINPIAKRLRLIRPLAQAEIMVVFVMGMVSAGMPSMGTCSYMMPLISGLFNKSWNTEQSRWDIYVEPFVNERFFIAPEGMRAAAGRLREVELDWNESQRILRAATAVEDSRARLAEAQTEVQKATRAPGPKDQDIVLRQLHRRLTLSQQAATNATLWWKQYQNRYNVANVLATYSNKVGVLEKEKERFQAELTAMEAETFEAISVFREGLPEDQRAVPGLIYVPGEGLDSYLARIQRLKHGRAAWRQLRRLDRALTGAIDTGQDIRPDVDEGLRKAGAMLSLIANADHWTAEKQKLAAEIGADRDALLMQERQLRLLHRWQRVAYADQTEEVGRKIAKLRTEILKIKKNIDKLEMVRDEKINPQLAMVGRIATAAASLEELRAGLDALDPGRCRALQLQLREQMARFGSFDASLRRFFIGDIHWRIWLKPVFNWAGLMLLTYLSLMTLNMLVYRQWAHHEKIVYPLAELPLVLSDTGSNPSGSMPLIFRSGLFWAGFAISATVLGWNSLVCKHLPGINPIPLTWLWDDYIQGSVLDGLRPYARFHVFFTLIGLTFLVPARISFSLWSFHIVYFIELLALVALGYGVNAFDFADGQTTGLAFRNGQGGGAVFVFVGFMLWQCRRYIFCCLAPGAVASLDSSERKELRTASALFILGSLGVVAVLWLGMGANPFWAAAFYLIVLMISLALIRVVAEGGLLGYISYFSPFHVFRQVIGLNHVWTPPGFIVPLFLYHMSVFWEGRAFVGPAMGNALRIRDRLGLKRPRFYGSVALAILVAFAVGVLSHIVLAYFGGAEQMNTRFYGTEGSASDAFGVAQWITKEIPADVGNMRWWIAVGAAVMTALLYFRRRVFWLPHPIGLVMFMSPIMHTYWFSILLGWIFKTLVSRYGNKDTYARLRYLFIGLIIGELFMCVVAPGVSLDRQ